MCRPVLPISSLLFIFLLSGVEAVTIQTNVDTEPFIIKSPAIGDPGDGFGWATVIHQLEEVIPSDDRDAVLGKTRWNTVVIN